jgi:ammonium transporter, Amt family
VQLGYQIADSVAGFSYSFGMTCIILFIMNFIPGLSLRVSAEEEELGLDDAQLGEFAYDYVELARHPADAIQGELPPSSHGSLKEKKEVSTELPVRTVE